MIWLTWRQFRAQTWTALTALVVAAVALGITGPGLARLYDTSGVASCVARDDCVPATSAFLGAVSRNAADDVLLHLGPWVMFALPALVGMFWGAPLITREFETGSFRMVWNQSITRTRWLAVKLALVGLASMALTGLLGLAIAWWAGPVQGVAVDRMSPGMFGGTGIVPVGYAAFAFAVGVSAGIVIRRTLPAMAVTLAVTAGAQAFAALWLTVRLMTPVRVSSPLTSPLANWGWNLSPRTGRFQVFWQPPNIPGAWMMTGSENVTTPDHVASQACLAELGRGPAIPPAACTASIARLHLTEVVTYQPASHYWPLQWYETAIFLGLALILAAFCLWRVTRRG